MMLTGKNLIGFTLSGENEKTFRGNAGDIVFHEASANEIAAAATKAHTAFATYRFLSPGDKARFLEAIAEKIALQKDELVATAILETFLAKQRLEGEVQRTINQIKLFANTIKESSWVKAIIDTAQPERKPLPKPGIRQMQIAIGPVAVFGASNFPFAFSVAGGDTVSALAAGCPVLCKAHPGHPATSEMVAKIIIEAAKETNLPDGVFSLLQGISHECSLQLVTHPFIKAVGFTGSFTGGRALFDAASKRNEPIPVYAEMGSVNPVFVLPGLLKENTTELADKLVASNLLSAGQFCTNPGIIISLNSNDAENFSRQFAQKISASSGECMLNENIFKGYQKGVERITATKDVQTIAVAEVKEQTATAHMFQTNAKTFLSHTPLWDEVFGPSSLHVLADDKNDFIAIARQMPGQLTASIWGTEDDLKDFADVVHEIELKVGRVIFNNVPTGVEVTHAMVHGGPYPATTDSRSTSVGTTAIYRFTRAVCYQNCPDHLLPKALQNANPLGIQRLVDGELSNGAIKE